MYAYNKQLIEINIMVSFNEKQGFYYVSMIPYNYDFQATLSANVCYFIIANQTHFTEEKNIQNFIPSH